MKIYYILQMKRIWCFVQMRKLRHSEVNELDPEHIDHDCQSWVQTQALWLQESLFYWSCQQVQCGQTFPFFQENP